MNTDECIGFPRIFLSVFILFICGNSSSLWDLRLSWSGTVPVIGVGVSSPSTQARTKPGTGAGFFLGGEVRDCDQPSDELFLSRISAIGAYSRCIRIVQPQNACDMVPFVLLENPAKYVACSWDLSLDAEGRLHWVEFFKRHLGTILNLGYEAAKIRGEDLEDLSARAEACRVEFFAFFDGFAADPNNVVRYGVPRVTILTMDQWRDALLRRHGFVDAFLDLKNRENEKALPLLATVCGQIDAMSGEEQFRAVIEGVFAGNIFDMGAEATAKAYLNSGPDFFATRKTLSPRPWLIDDFDAAAARFLDGPPHHKAVFFIDNAGSDFLLGALPMIRWMAKRGTTIILAANERPTLNDMTIGDVNHWWPRILEVEPSLGDLPIHRVSTGTGEPLIDLAEVSDELNTAAADADLVILEGMGRGVESNLDAAFRCDAMNLAMIKDTMIAKRNDGKLFDVICQFR